MERISENSMKRDKKGRFITDNPKNDWMRVTEEEKLTISELRTYQINPSKNEHEYKLKFLNNLHVSFKLFAIEKNQKFYVSKFIGNEVVKINISDYESSYLILNKDEIITIFDYFDQESQKKLIENHELKKELLLLKSSKLKKI